MDWRGGRRCSPTPWTSVCSTTSRAASCRSVTAPRTRTAPGRLDTAYYDLLASEARLASFIAIAKGDVPETHWFRLGQPITSVSGVPTLLSWSATLFEYLMPLLVMRSYPDTLLDETCRMAACGDRSTTRPRAAVPWGISECAYNIVDQTRRLSVPRLRRSRPRSETRAWRRPRRRAVRDGTRRAHRSGGGGAEPAAAERGAVSTDRTGTTTPSTTRHTNRIARPARHDRAARVRRARWSERRWRIIKA